MRKQEFYLVSANPSQKLHTILWEPEEKPVAVVQLVHGMMEYIDRYDEFAQFLTLHQFAVIGHDHLGHGYTAQNEADRCFFADENGEKAIVEDMMTITREAHQRFAGLPVFIVGHSMGSFFLRNYLTRYSAEVNGAIIMGTGYVSKWVARFGKCIAAVATFFHSNRYHSQVLTAIFMYGNEKPFRSEGKLGWLSKSKKNQAWYAATPLCNYTFTVGAYDDFFDCMVALDEHRNFESIRRTLPVLILAGEDDPVGGRKASDAVKKDLLALGLTDVEEHIYEGFRHEILHEDEPAQVYADILSWLNRHIQKG